MRLSRLYATAALCIASSLAFFLTAVVKLPVALYFPLSRRWSLTPIPGELSMDYYGRSLLALLAGLAAAALTLAVFRVRALFGPRVAAPPVDDGFGAARAPDPGRGLALLAGYAVTALALAAGVYAYELYGRTPIPEPLPAELLQAPPFPPGFPSRSSDAAKDPPSPPPLAPPRPE